MLVKLTKAYEEVAKKSHRMRLDSLEVFIFHYLGFYYGGATGRYGCTYGHSATGTANGNGPSAGRRPP